MDSSFDVCYSYSMNTVQTLDWKFGVGDLIQGGKDKSMGRVLARVTEDFTHFYKIFWLESKHEIVPAVQFKLYQKTEIEHFYERVN